MSKSDATSINRHVCGVILAGGSSARMGQDKSMLRINGIPLIQHIHAQLTARFETIVIGANDREKYAFLPCDIIPDEHPDQGPLMAIYSVLSALQKPGFIVATDIPEIPLSVVDGILNLAQANPDSQAIVPVTAKGEYEPLCALYRPEIIPFIRDALAKGNRHIYGLFSSVPVTRYLLQPDETLHNLNQPDDYHRYITSVR